MPVDAVLDSWRTWDSRLDKRPIVLRTLGGGRSNRSFLLDSNIGKLVLRLNAMDDLLPAANRNCESQIWQAASEEEIAPPLLHVDKKTGFLVSVYINNKLPEQAPLNDGYIKQAFELLSHCHQLQVISAPLINYANHIEQYWDVINRNRAPVQPKLIEQREAMQLVLEHLINSEKETVLCHHDPVIANFVGSPDKLYLIDWEYAALGLRVMDYAAFATEWKLDDELVMAQSGIEPQQLMMAKTLYSYICDLWEVQNGPRGQPGAIL